jgi:ATP adenylyltransferase
VDSLEKLTSRERTDLMDTLIKVQGMMKKAFAPHAFNVGLNLGHLAGAGIPEHLHVHIVPRWSGDVNFMPALFGTKIIPVALDKTYERLMDENSLRNRKKRK